VLPFAISRRDVRMNAEILTVLIVAKTRRKGGACIGAVTSDGRSVRLEAANAAYDERAGMEYQVGDVWKIEAEPHPQIVPPHVETIVVYGKRRLRSHVDPVATIEKFMPPVSGGPGTLYEGLVQSTDSGALYIAERSGVPTRSTLFWRPDRPLRLLENGVRLHYCYPADNGEQRMAFVGFQEPLEEIPAGSIVRVSVAHWWRPREHPADEARCYLQLSGWFLAGESGRAVRRDAASKPGEVGGIHLDVRRALADGVVADGRVQQVLKDVFGYDSFRPLQEDIIGKLLDGRDTLAVMPTGAGKSLCYQLPALIWERLTVVVSPLISLMQDQVEALHALAVPAAYLNSTLTYAEQRHLMERVRDGAVKLLYVAPETLVRPEVLHMLDHVGVDCLAVDEAHCISAWGHDFRPIYRQLEPVRRRFDSAVCLAMTATAAPRVRADIKQSLGIADADQFVASFDRPNLFLAAQPRTNGERQLQAFLGERRDQSGIIYCATKRQVEALSDRLHRRGFSVLPYHAGLDDRTRRDNQRAFVHDHVQIIVATVAFGMGINKSNVRFVVHYNMPASLEAYYQEIGRSGRDGVRADCLLLYHMQDVQFHSRLIGEGAEDEQPGRSARLQAMLRFAQAHGCRRPSLLHYFGEERSEEACGFCDNCLAGTGEQLQVDVTEAAQKFFSCVLRTGEIFGASHIIDILRGSQNRKVLERHHELLPAYAKGKEYSADRWRSLAQQWIQQQLLEQDMQHGGLRLTGYGREVLRGERQAYAEPETKPGLRDAPGQAQRREGSETPAYDSGVFEHLRSLRRRLAQAGNLPPYMVFSDRSLVEMATYLPQTATDFVAISGVGRAKVERYGQEFISAITTYCAEHDLKPQPRPARAQPVPPAPRGHGVSKRARETGELFAAGASLGSLQELFAVKRSTIVSYLRDFLSDGGHVDSERLRVECTLPAEVQERVLALIGELGSDRLTPIYEALHGAVDYEELHLLRLAWLTQAHTA
jgi:ATP-dependent DNA helicase RecQ